MEASIAEEAVADSLRIAAAAMAEHKGAGVEAGERGSLGIGMGHLTQIPPSAVGSKAVRIEDEIPLILGGEGRVGIPGRRALTLGPIRAQITHPNRRSSIRGVECCARIRKNDCASWVSRCPSRARKGLV